MEEEERELPRNGNIRAGYGKRYPIAKASAVHLRSLWGIASDRITITKYFVRWIRITF
jgi:hypothetical protein